MKDKLKKIKLTELKIIQLIEKTKKFRLILLKKFKFIKQIIQRIIETNKLNYNKFNLSK